MKGLGNSMVSISSPHWTNFFGGDETQPKKEVQKYSYEMVLHLTNGHQKTLTYLDEKLYASPAEAWGDLKDWITNDVGNDTFILKAKGECHILLRKHIVLIDFFCFKN